MEKQDDAIASQEGTKGVFHRRRKKAVQWVNNNLGVELMWIVAFIPLYVVLRELFKSPLELLLSPILDRPTVDLFTIALAMLAIYYARKHHAGLTGQTDQLEKHVDHLSKLNDYLSTRRTGPFPEYLNDICSLAKTADNLDILIDCLDFGSFFDPPIHSKIHDAICDLANVLHRPVRILVCADVPEPFTGPSGQELDSQELLDKYCLALQRDEGFVDWLERSHKDTSDNYDEFSATWLKVKEKDKETSRIINLKDNFAACINACKKENSVIPRVAEKDVVTSLLQLRQFWFAIKLQQAHVQIQGLSKSEPLFFWIKYEKTNPKGSVRKDDARFTFANAARGPSQLGFETHDPDLLTVFRMIFTEKWAEAEKAAKVAQPGWLKYLEKFDTLGKP